MPVAISHLFGILSTMLMREERWDQTDFSQAGDLLPLSTLSAGLLSFGAALGPDVVRHKLSHTAMDQSLTWLDRDQSRCNSVTINVMAWLYKGIY